MLIFIAAVIVAGAVLKGALLVSDALKSGRPQGEDTRVADLLATFAPAIAAAETDGRAILVWEPLARTGRRLFPEEFSRLDAAAGGSFPFTKARLEAAHATWTADWLAWERTHDTEYKLKAAEAEQVLAASGGSSVARAHVEAIEREKLDLYQRRYQEYIRIAKALQALVTDAK